MFAGPSGVHEEAPVALAVVSEAAPVVEEVLVLQSDFLEKVTGS